MIKYKTSLLLPLLLGLPSCAGLDEPTSGPQQAENDQELYGLGSLATKWPNGIVPVCFENVNDHPELQAKIPALLGTSWSINANITFTGFGPCSTAPTNRVAVSFSTVSGFRGVTFGLGFGARSITLIGDDTGSLTHFRYEVIHEFGHALGFVHEMKRPDNWNGTVAKQCGVSPSDADYGNYSAQPGGITLTAAYDPNSVMNYCNPLGFPTVLSAGDMAGASRPDAYGPPPPAASANVLVQSTTAGDLDLWTFQGNYLRSNVPLGVRSLDWQVAGTGDFDGDGQGDILWRNTNGQVEIWYMFDSIVVRTQQSGGTDPSHIWSIQGVGDFNHDGHADILWRDTSGQLAIWFEGSALDTAFPGYNNTPAPVDLAWQVKGVGDFDNDGHADILWRNSNGQVGIWFMSAGTRVGEAYPGGLDPSGIWQIQGVGDFDGDHRADILWRDNTGVLAIWPQGDINAATFPTYQSAGGPGNLAFSIRGIGDFDGDGVSDIMWVDAAGGVAFWYMAHNNYSRDAYPATLAAGWAVRTTVATFRP
jgi:hypothetical protein